MTKRGSIALARSLRQQIEPNEDYDLDGRQYGSVDIAKILSAEVERLRAGAASCDAAFEELEQDYSAKCNELELVYEAKGAEIEALRADADFAIDMLAMMFDKYENGVTCYEDPEECSGALGNAISIDNADFHAIADFLNKHRPVAALAVERGKT